MALQEIVTTAGIVVCEVGDPGVMRSEIDRESGSLICWRDFEVTRPGREAHRVSVEIGEDGFSQEDRCDCRGFEFRGHCCHLTAVHDSGILDEEGE